MIHAAQAKRFRRMPFVNTAAMNAHLAEIARTVAPFVGEMIPQIMSRSSSPHALLILDGAGWHGSAALVIPDNLALLTLSPYSPELNPVENVGAYRRAITVFDRYEDIVDTCCSAWNFFANDPEAIASTTSRSWAEVS